MYALVHLNTSEVFASPKDNRTSFSNSQAIFSKNIKMSLKQQGLFLASSSVHTDTSARGSGLKRQKATGPAFRDLGDLSTSRGTDRVSEEKLRFKE